MEDLEQVIRDIFTISFEKDSAHWVDVIHIIDPHNFFVRLTKYRSIIDKIESSKPVLKPSCIELQSMVLFSLKQDSDYPKYARGKIQYIENIGNIYRCDIYAEDYGYFEKDVSFERIWQCDQIFVNMPSLAIKCQLAHCAPPGGEYWGEAIKIFKLYVGKERAKMIILDNTSEKLLVVLYNSCPDDIATLLALTDYTTMGYVHNDINRMAGTLSTKTLRYYFQFKKFDINSTLRVRTLSGRTLEEFYVAEVSDYKKYLKERDNITWYSSKEPLITEDILKPDEIVAVQNDLKGYNRAIIKNVIAGGKTVVQLVDVGKYETVPATKVRKLPKKYLEMPVLAIFCSADMNGITDDQHRLFLCPGYEFLITIKQTGVEFKSPYIISLNTP